MKEKINYANCMKRKCEMCKHYDECFRYKGGNENESKSNKQIQKIKFNRQ